LPTGGFGLGHWFATLAWPRTPDVDHRLRPLDAVTHQIDEVGATSQELCPRLEAIDFNAVSTSGTLR
jgi:hypothetical protein